MLAVYGEIAPVAGVTARWLSQFFVGFHDLGLLKIRNRKIIALSEIKGGLMIVGNLWLVAINRFYCDMNSSSIS